MNYPKERNLDGVYYRVKRDGKYQSICFSDLTVDEQKMCLKGFDREALERMCLVLGETIRAIGDQLDLYNE